MNQDDLKKRSKEFALRLMKLVDALPKTTAGRGIGNQLVLSGTSVRANHRASCWGRSKAEFVARLGTVIEEADESGFWLHLIVDGQLLDAAQVNPLLEEASEQVAIFTASQKTAKSAISYQQS